jgi:hypothetical protein
VDAGACGAAWGQGRTGKVARKESDFRAQTHNQDSKMLSIQAGDILHGVVTYVPGGGDLGSAGGRAGSARR